MIIRKQLFAEMSQLTLKKIASELGTLTAGLEYPNVEAEANYYPSNLIRAQRTRNADSTHVDVHCVLYLMIQADDLFMNRTNLT